jgi:hypothetical protein
MSTAKDFRRIALSFPDAVEGEHCGNPDFRVGERKFATLAHASKGYGNLPLTPELQAEFIAEAPEIFLPVAGGWGRMGHTHLVLANANEDMLRGALQASYNLRVKKNSATKKRTPRKK